MVLGTGRAGRTSAKEARQGRSRWGFTPHTVSPQTGQEPSILTHLVEEVADLCLNPTSSKRQSRPCSFLNNGCLKLGLEATTLLLPVSGLSKSPPVCLDEPGIPRALLS